MKKTYGSPEEVEGFEELNNTDKEKIRAAWENEEVAAEDIPPTATGKLSEYCCGSRSDECTSWC